MSTSTKLPPNEVSRRRVFAGAGTATALAAAAAVLPLAQQATGTAGAKKLLTPDADGRYQVTQHVLRYYQTTQV